MYNKASGMAHTLLLDVFAQFYKFLKKRDGAQMIKPLIIKRESHISDDQNNKVMFPYGEIEQDYKNLLAQESRMSNRENNRQPQHR